MGFAYSADQAKKFLLDRDGEFVKYVIYLLDKLVLSLTDPETRSLGREDVIGGSPAPPAWRGLPARLGIARTLIGSAGGDAGIGDIERS
jgi:hypothetical protein